LSSLVFVHCAETLTNADARYTACVCCRTDIGRMPA
jgi:hypothetical protein